MSSLLSASAASLAHSHIFGFNGSIINPLHFIDATASTALYCAGHNVVLHNRQTRQQRCISGTDVNGAEGPATIVGLATTPSGRYVAIAERMQRRWKITVADTRTLRKRRIVSNENANIQTTEIPETAAAAAAAAAPGTVITTDTVAVSDADVAGDVPSTSNDLVDLMFSGDGKRLLTLSTVDTNGITRYELSEWAWQKVAVTATAFIGADVIADIHCSYSHDDDARLLCVSGRRLLAFYTADDIHGTFAPVGNTSTVTDHYSDHCWTGAKRLIAVTANGEAHAYDNGAFISAVFAAADAVPITCTAAIGSSGGFATAHANGIIRTFRYDTTLTTYTAHQTVHIAESVPTTHRITYMTVTPASDAIAFVTSNDQSMIINNFAALRTDADVTAAHAEHVTTPHHFGAVSGMAICVRKPIIVTTGTDRTVRVWNYQSKTQELCVSYPEPPLSVSVHPSGLHVLIGFADKLRLMNIFIDDLRLYKEFAIKGCTETAFAHGGHLFAAINVGLIQIYNTYTAEQVAVFRGHTALVKSLHWSLDDTRIVSAGNDGAVYERRIGHSGRSAEFVQKGCKLNCAISTSDDRMFAVGDDRLLKEISDKSVTKTLDAGVILTQIVISAPPQRMLFASTINGAIRSFVYPLTGIVKDVQAHSKAVTRLRMSADDSILCSASEDGSLIVFAVEDILKARPQLAADITAAASAASVSASACSTAESVASSVSAALVPTGPPVLIPFSEEILITRGDLEDKHAALVELKSRVDELTASNEYQLRLHDMNYAEKLKEVSEKYALQVEHDRSKLETVRDECNELANEYEEKLAAVGGEYQQHGAERGSSPTACTYVGRGRTAVCGDCTRGRSIRAFRRNGGN